MSHTCPLCRTRKARRPCPATGQQICTVCCGTKRLREINCPPTCVFLASAATHPPAVVQRRQERDVSFLLPFLTELPEPQYRLLLLFQGLALQHSAIGRAPGLADLQLGRPTLTDQDVVEAANTVAATLETARKGIIYHHQAAALPAQQLVATFEKALQDLTAKAGSHAATLERDAAAALRQLARAAAAAGRSLAGDPEPVFLNVLSRVMTAPARRGDGADEDQARGEESPPRLIIPG